MSSFFSGEIKDQGKLGRFFLGIYDCSKKKTFFGAIILYFGNLWAGGVLARVIGLVADKAFGITVNSMYANMKLWLLMPALVVVWFSFDVLRQRKLLKSSLCVGLALFSGLLAFRLGALGGFLVTSYLSTRENKDEPKSHSIT